MKRLFDIIFSSLGLLFLGPLLVACAFFIKLDSPGPVFFLQERIGKNFKHFSIIHSWALAAKHYYDEYIIYADFKFIIKDAQKTGY